MYLMNFLITYVNLFVSVSIEAKQFAARLRL